MIKSKKIITTLLVSIILLVSFIIPTYATTQNEVNQPKSETTTPIPQDTRNGDLTKNSKYPFYDECNVLSKETKGYDIKNQQKL